jgi:dipeptidyl aminopeptidase/acylaminoacyl peptidase
MRYPQLDQVRLSVSGRYLSAVVPLKGRMNLVVIDLEKRESKQVTAMTDFDVIFSRWVGDEHLVFSLGFLDTPTGAYSADGGGLFVVSRDGAHFRELSPIARESAAKRQRHRELSFFASIPGNENEIIASGNFDVIDATDLYRVNLLTGKRSLLTAWRPVSKPFGWVLDDKLRPRVVSEIDEFKRERVVYYRGADSDTWTEISRQPSADSRVFQPRFFDSASNALIVASNEGRDTVGLVRFDPETKKVVEPVAAHPRFDMGASGASSGIPGLIVGHDRRLQGFLVNADKPEVVWTDPIAEKVQKAIDSVRPNTINVIEANRDLKKWLVTSYSEQTPTYWSIFDVATGQLEPAGKARPWLEGKLHAKQLPIRFKARDGLDLTGYIFVPQQYEKGRPLPTVVHIHGGPAVRADAFARGYGVREAQVLASRGYVVILPNFRITPGMGTKSYQAGFGTVGRAMSDDHEDALKWAVEQGYADPERACISGASYGGYAALQALTRATNPFKCAISGLAVTDMKFQNTSTLTDYTTSKAATDFWKRLLGVKEFDEPVVRTISPIYQADKIKNAVFMYGGREDRRVPFTQMADMADALTQAGNPPKEFIVKADEGHGFGLLENRVELYTKILNFLGTQIGVK